jgi:uncharacterized protein
VDASAGDGEAALEHAVLEDKARALRDALASCESLLIAFSGGADSAYLAWKPPRCSAFALCITADSPVILIITASSRCASRASSGCATKSFTRRAREPEYRANPTNRCYYCKHELYTTLTRIGAERGIAVIADGSNADDRGDYRPGRQAAREFGVRSPLDEVASASRRFASCREGPACHMGRAASAASRRAFRITRK